MKYLYALIYFLLMASTVAGHADTSPRPLKVNTMTVKMNINIQQFYVRLNDNPAAKAFVEALPLQLGMDELNGNEKFADLPHALPSAQCARVPFRPAISCCTVNKRWFCSIHPLNPHIAIHPLGKLLIQRALSAA